MTACTSLKDQTHISYAHSQMHTVLTRLSLVEASLGLQGTL